MANARTRGARPSQPDERHVRFQAALLGRANHIGGQNGITPEATVTALGIRPSVIQPNVANGYTVVAPLGSRRNERLRHRPANPQCLNHASTVGVGNNSQSRLVSRDATHSLVARHWSVRERS